MRKRTMLLKLANYDIEKLFENYCKYYCQVYNDNQFMHMVKWREKINDVVAFLKEELGNDCLSNLEAYDYAPETKEHIHNIASVYEIVNRS